MSANSDTKKLLDYAESKGMIVELSKHGGYRIMQGDRAVCYVQKGGSQRPNSIIAARRRIDKATDG